LLAAKCHNTTGLNSQPMAQSYWPLSTVLTLSPMVDKIKRMDQVPAADPVKVCNLLLYDIIL
jgi:hypothetical protein